MTLNGLAIGFAAGLLVASCACAEDAGQGTTRPFVELAVPHTGVTGSTISTAQCGERRFSVLRTVKDEKGTYTIPYIQSSRTLAFELRFSEESVVKAQVSLNSGQSVVAEVETEWPDFALRVADLPYGEYSLAIRGLDREGGVACSGTLDRLGIGIVIAAIGDSITEGYFGRGFWRKDLDLEAGCFPADAVSRDGRNLPQFAPTTGEHLPEVNCFESWMTELNDLLAASWRHPVFIANEGWGGFTSGAYLELMRSSEGWRTRMRTLQPTVWLLHLGVNDERAKTPAERFAATMRAIVDELVQEFGAKPSRIFVARPSYDYAEGAAAILALYCEKLDHLCAQTGVQPGPDLFEAYATERERWYGEDPVHPNVGGITRMAHLWHEAVVKRIAGSAP